MDMNISHIIGGIGREEFTADYQPIYDVADGRWVGMEALIRWRKQDTGATVAAPDGFLPAALATGLMPTLGNLVASIVCKQIAAWGNLLDGRTVSLNVCPTQLVNDNLIKIIEGFVARGALPPGVLHIELTEHVPLMLDATMQQRLRKLRELGCKVILDDLGSGFMSLNKLTELEVDGFKYSPFDSCCNDAYSERTQALIAATAQLAKSLGVELVVERVENQMQHDYLQQFPGVLGQGYFYSKPMNYIATTTQLINAQHAANGQDGAA